MSERNKSVTLKSLMGTGTSLTVSTAMDDMVDYGEVWIRAINPKTGDDVDLYVSAGELRAALEEVGA